MTRRAIVLCLTVLVCISGTVVAADDEEAAIKEVVQRAYVEGVHVDQDPEKMRSGMHDSFVMFVQRDGGIMQVTRDAWVERMTAAPPSSEPRSETTANIEVLDRAGNAAVVKVELFRDGEQIFTDYISLYRFDDGWKLVGKIFHRH